MIGKIIERLRETVSLILLLGSIVAFIITLRANFQLYAVISAIIFLITLIASCIYVLRAKNPPQIEGGKGTYRYSDMWRDRALACLGGAIGIVFAYGIFNANRTYVIVAFTGTPIPPSNLSACGDYELRIISPQPNDKVPGTFTVKGTYVNPPPEDSILLLLKSSAGDYFPQEKVKIDRSEKTWQAKVNRDTGQDFVLIVSIMGSNGRALFNYYTKVGRDTRKWPAIEVLTDDIQVCYHVDIAHEPFYEER